jgi:hypothetical protein
MPQALKLEAEHYFGSFEKAIAALKNKENGGAALGDT